MEGRARGVQPGGALRVLGVQRALQEHLTHVVGVAVLEDLDLDKRPDGPLDQLREHLELLLVHVLVVHLKYDVALGDLAGALRRPALRQPHNLQLALVVGLEEEPHAADGRPGGRRGHGRELVRCRGCLRRGGRELVRSWHLRSGGLGRELVRSRGGIRRRGGGVATDGHNFMALPLPGVVERFEALGAEVLLALFAEQRRDGVLA
mmetsp:Transcript_56213/g.133507  ORF Transcript_56213/g.133507 Transcript_56213/m.133507 type:complete len:206 (+) Transcript_56213:3076-3693(+)